MEEKLPTRQIKLAYSFFKRPWNVLLVTLFGVSIYYLFAYSFLPEQFTTGGLSFFRLLFYMLVDQLGIECVTTFILFRLIVLYARGVKLDKVSMDVKSIFRYQVTFLPVVLLAFFVFNPVTQTLRFLLREFPTYTWSQYAALYGYSIPLYLTYLGVVFLMVYLSLNLNLLMEAGRGVNTRVPDPANSFQQWIIGQVEGVEKLIAIPQIRWFELKDRICYACTPGGQYRVARTMKQLEEALPPDQFVRLNRSVIANIDAIDSFTPWFNGRYVVRMKGPRRVEFTMSKERARAFKAQLSGLELYPSA